MFRVIAFSLIALCLTLAGVYSSIFYGHPINIETTKFNDKPDLVDYEADYFRIPIYRNQVLQGYLAILVQGKVRADVSNRVISWNLADSFYRLFQDYPVDPDIVFPKKEWIIEKTMEILSQNPTIKMVDELKIVDLQYLKKF